MRYCAFGALEVVAVMCFFLLQSEACSCNTTTTWDALAELYYATNGAGWRNNSRWLEPGSIVCDWYGFFCGTSSYGFTTLNLTGNNLRGTLPATFMLTMLDEFCVSNNNLSGTLPPEYSNWSGIKAFDVRNNKISGTLPPQYSNWIGFWAFFVSSNNISGTLPAEYSNWTGLWRFYVSSNNISGTLPPEFSNWRALVEFEANSNRISGTLPPGYRSWSGVSNFAVRSNNISGTLPPQYSSWIGLWAFLVSSNSISGILPPQYSSWVELESFDVGNNSISGTLPPEYSNWTALLFFNVYSNNISGTMPPQYSSWTLLESFNVGDNSISGTLSPKYSSWTRLDDFKIFNNRISGALPPEYSRWALLREFNVNSNNISGTLPTQYSSWTPHLIAFFVSNNYISGTLPSWTKSLSSNFVVMAFHNNTLLSGIWDDALVRFGRFVVVSLCGTKVRVCKSKACTTTWFFCFDIPFEGSDTLLTLVLTLSLSSFCSVSACTSNFTAATAPTSSTPVVAASSTALHAAGSGFVVAVAAATSAAGLLGSGASRAAGALLLVTLHASDIARRVAQCRDDGVGEDGSPIGLMFADSPTQLRLPGETSVTGGAVLGNALLTYGAPLVVAGASVGWRHWRGKVAATRAGYAAAYVLVVLSVSSVLQVPTAAASVSLLLQHGSGAAVCLGVFGVLLVLAPLCGVAFVVVREHPVQGCVLLSRQRRGRSTTVASSVTQLLTRRRSAWSVAVARKEASEMAAVPRVVLGQLLEGYHYPHSWTAVSDVASMVVQGLLTGVASTSSVCRSILAASWCLFGVSVVSVGVSVGARPRSTVGECVIDIAMNVWTSAALLLSALGIEDDSEGSMLAQAAVQLLWILTLCLLRAWVLRQQSKAIASNSGCSEHLLLHSTPKTREDKNSSRWSNQNQQDIHDGAGVARRSRDALVVGGVLLQQASLERLVRMACRRGMDEAGSL